MNKHIFYAHSITNYPKSYWHPLQSHAENAANITANFAKFFNAQEIAYHIGLLHDLGKCTEKFKRRLNGENISVDHATEGAKTRLFCKKATNEKNLEKERTTGRKYIVLYALYRVHGFISANLAAKTGFSNDDLAKLWETLKLMFEHDRSAARDEMAARKLIVFKHGSALGSLPVHKLFDAVKVECVGGKAARQHPHSSITASAWIQTVSKV